MAIQNIKFCCLCLFVFTNCEICTRTTLVRGFFTPTMSAYSIKFVYFILGNYRQWLVVSMYLGISPTFGVSLLRLTYLRLCFQFPNYLGRGAENRTQTCGFRDRRANLYATPQYIQGRLKKSFSLLCQLSYLPIFGRESRTRTYDTRLGRHNFFLVIFAVSALLYIYYTIKF